VSVARALVRRVPRFPLRAERREVTFDSRLLESLRGGGSVLAAAGVSVTVEGALRLSAVLGAVLLIAESIASVPLSLYERTPNGGRRVRSDHPLHRLLHDQANPILTAFDVRATMMAHRLLYGNAYAEIEWDRNGYPVAIWPLDPLRVGVVMTQAGELAYTYWSDEFGGVALPARRVHHQRGLLLRGYQGLSPIRTAATTVGLGIATEEFGARYFVNGAAPSVVLSHPAKLTAEALRNLRTSFEMQWSGLSNAHRIAVVGEGVKPELLSVPIDESQFLESRQFQVKEIARLFKIPVGLLGETDTATYASAEQELIRFRELTLAPLAEHLEKEIERDFLTADEQRTLFTKHILEKLQGTDLKTRFETHQIAKNTGLFSTNEIREMEDRNPVEGGDELWMPLNMAPASIAAKTTAYGQILEENSAQQPDVGAAWLADIENRVRARVANDVRLSGTKAMRKNKLEGFDLWAREQVAQWLTAAMRMLTPLSEVATVDSRQALRWIDEELAAQRALLEENDHAED
jgi:HK97 family phage portal protein